MSLLEHLEDLRRCILRCALAIALGMAIAAPFTPRILETITLPLRELGRDPSTFLMMPNITDGFKVAFSLVFWSGLLLAAPFVVLFIAHFIFPGLHEHERRLVRRSSLASILLFFGGAALGYFSSVQLALEVLLFQIPDWLGVGGGQYFATSYISFVLKLVLGFGLAFELPLLLLLIGYAGLVEPATLRKYRRHTVIVLLTLAMILTPPEPVSQVIMASCLYLLYELCILLIANHQKKTSP